jgi:tRNA(Ile)-lysidine synthetase-like protein
MSFYNNYEDVLEYVPSNQKQIRNQCIKHEDLIDTIKQYCDEKRSMKYVVSLSGGVDSMVLISILHFLRFDVVGIHINYNNRKEGVSEMRFLEEWCAFNKILLYTKSINKIIRFNMKRTDYELQTKQIRFDFYKEVCKKEKSSYVLLGHHKDDIVENVFANVCRGRNMLDLAVIKKDSIINDVHIGRPMINYYKDIVYDFAHRNQIPYFKDSTPKWSVRGKYRNIIYPSIEDAFTKNVKENLIRLSAQSQQWNELIYQSIITPFISSIVIETNENKNKILQFNIEQFVDYPMCFWNIVFNDIFNKYGYKSPSQKGILSVITTIKKNISMEDHTPHKVSLSKECICIVQSFNILLEFY